jgi:4-amino-4-deoxy-L-arabinose transferase-like glycosyltransferase
MSLRRIFAAMALVLVLAPLAANAPLFDPDEGLHAAIAQEMVRRGDYVTPTFLGEPFLDKPILFFWAEAASLGVFGQRELAVRLPPLVFGVLGMVGVAALGRALFGEATGLLAGIVYGTMLLPLGVAEVAVHDVAVVPFLCAACASLCGLAPVAPGISRTSNRKTSSQTILVRTILAIGVALGLSILTKGLVAIAFTGLFAVALIALDRRDAGRVAIALAAAGVVAAAVALPWYLAMERAHPGYLHYYFVERHLQGYLTATQRHAGRGWWYYLPIVIGGSLPWTGYLADAARIARASQVRLAIWTWLTLGLVFLSAGESKLVTYALPVFPALALLAADAIVARGGFGYRPGYAVFAGVLTILAPAALGLVAWRFGPVDATIWTIVGLIAIAIAAVAATTAPRAAASLEAATVRVVRLPVMALFGLMIVLPRAAVWMTAKDLAGALNAGGALPPHVAVVGERVGSLIFYLSPRLRAAVTPDRVGEATIAEAIAQARIQPADAVVAVRDDEVARFARVFPSPPAADAHAGTFTIYRTAELRRASSPR